MAAAPSEPIRTMEALFRPTTRFRDLYHERAEFGFADILNDPLDGVLRTEVELLPHLTPEHVRATGIMWDTWMLFLRGKVVWMAPGVFVCADDCIEIIDDPVVLVLY
jgi:hypothetical protein